MTAGQLPVAFGPNRGQWAAGVDYGAKEQAYVTQQRAANKLPDVKILVDFMHQRQRLVMNAHGSVHGALTSASWDGLHTYINGDFQASLSQKKGAAK